jgi:hypothetical protein
MQQYSKFLEHQQKEEIKESTRENAKNVPEAPKYENIEYVDPDVGEYQIDLD